MKFNLEIKQASSVWDYIFLRKLRNSVRFSMTGSTKKITYFSQIIFYLQKPGNILIFICFLNGKRAGYLLLNHKNNYNLITEVILPQYRNSGIASALIDFAKKKYLPLKAEIYPSNQASINLHLKCGFKKVYSNDKFEEYELK